MDHAAVATQEFLARLRLFFVFVVLQETLVRGLEGRLVQRFLRIGQGRGRVPLGRAKIIFLLQGVQLE